ncbi:unnamed protein product [Prunus armeniaca]
MVEAAENRSAFANTCRKSSTTSQYPRRKSPLTSSVCSQKLKYLLLPSLPPFYRTSLASGTETSQLFAALPTRVPHAQGSPSALTFPLRLHFDVSTSPFLSFLRQQLSWQTAGTHWSCFHSPLVPNGRHTWVLFSLTPRAEQQARTGQFSITSRAERQARTSRVFTHLSCRTVGTHGSCFHSPLVPNGRHAWVLFSLTSRTERQAP